MNFVTHNMLSFFIGDLCGETSVLLPSNRFGGNHVACDDRLQHGRSQYRKPNRNPCAAIWRLDSGRLLLGSPQFCSFVLCGRIYAVRPITTAPPRTKTKSAFVRGGFLIGTRILRILFRLWDEVGTIPA